MANPVLPKLPFYLKIAQILIGIVAFFYILYIGRNIIIPVVFAFIISILLNPVVNWLHRKKVPRVLAITIALILAAALISGLVYFITSQIVQFGDTLPQLKEEFRTLFDKVLDWLSRAFGIRKDDVNNWLEGMKENGMGESTKMIGWTLTTTFNIISIVFLMPVYIFVILYYKPLFLEFFSRLFPSGQHGVVQEVLVESKSLTQRYLLGLMIETVIVAAMNCGGLMALGVQHAILLGVIGALLNLIPYIGLVIAMLLPALVVLATKSPVYVVWVVCLYTGIQLIDNNLIVPKIVASKVKINALISIIAVLVGGALWGVAGMFLSLPVTAIAKVICDRIEPLKPWGFLLGDTMPPIGKVHFRIRRKPQKMVE